MCRAAWVADLSSAPRVRTPAVSLVWLAGSGQTLPMTEWIYFIHPPRDDFAATMTAAEKDVWAEHLERLQRLLADGQLILAGPTLGTINTGLAIFEAPSEDAARQIMEADPVIRGGYARGELRPFRVSLLRGRD
jgi:uncharacterized protein YciI